MPRGKPRTDKRPASQPLTTIPGPAWRLPQDGSCAHRNRRPVRWARPRRGTAGRAAPDSSPAVRHRRPPRARPPRTRPDLPRGNGPTSSGVRPASSGSSARLRRNGNTSARLPPTGLPRPTRTGPSGCRSPSARPCSPTRGSTRTTARTGTTGGATTGRPSGSVRPAWSPRGARPAGRGRTTPSWSTTGCLAPSGPAGACSAAAPRRSRCLPSCWWPWPSWRLPC